MKKNYFSPEIATMDVQLSSVLCGSGDSNMNNDQLNGGDSGNSSMNGAPRRNVF